MIRPTIQIIFETNDGLMDTLLEDINTMAKSKYFDTIFKKAQFTPILHENYYVNQIHITLPFDSSTFKNIIQLLNNSYKFSNITNDFLKNVMYVDILNFDYNKLVEAFIIYYSKNEINCNIVKEICEFKNIDIDHKITFFNSIANQINDDDTKTIETKFNATKINGKCIEYNLVAKDKMKTIKWDFGNKSYTIVCNYRYDYDHNKYSMPSDRGYNDLYNKYTFTITSTEKNYTSNKKNIYQKCLIVISSLFGEILMEKEQCTLNVKRSDDEIKFKCKDNTNLQFKISITNCPYFKIKNTNDDR
jgi:hypothetical protein